MPVCRVFFIFLSFFLIIHSTAGAEYVSVSELVSGRQLNRNNGYLDFTKKHRIIFNRSFSGSEALRMRVNSNDEVEVEVFRNEFCVITASGKPRSGTVIESDKPYNISRLSNHANLGYLPATTNFFSIHLEGNIEIACDLLKNETYVKGTTPLIDYNINDLINEFHLIDILRLDYTEDEIYSVATEQLNSQSFELETQSAFTVTSFFNWLNRLSESGDFVFKLNESCNFIAPDASLELASSAIQAFTTYTIKSVYSSHDIISFKLSSDDLFSEISLHCTIPDKDVGNIKTLRDFVESTQIDHLIKFYSK